LASTSRQNDGLSFAFFLFFNSKRFFMNKLFCVFSIVTAQLVASTAYAQTAPSDNAAARAERKLKGAQAAREFMPGEGDPKPEPKVKASKAERVAAKQARRAEGAQAALSFQPGEGDPKPEATAKAPRAERSAERKARRTAITKANKAGQIPSYGDNYGGR